MSKAWAGGSSRVWRKLRLAILNRDGWVCQLCDRAIDPRLRPPHPLSSSVHHTVGKETSGDDPRYLVASHRSCNQDAGDPSRHDPTPQSATRW